jgi:hypothetical protein
VKEVYVVGDGGDAGRQVETVSVGRHSNPGTTPPDIIYCVYSRTSREVLH